MFIRAHARVWSRVGTSIPTHVALPCGRAGPDPCGRRVPPPGLVITALAYFVS